MPLFNGLTARLLWQSSRGIPRLINVLAHKCLMQAYGRRQTRICWRDVFRAARDTEDASPPVAWLGWGVVILLGGIVLAGIGSRLL
jgi:MSHA biogenesis protein MshM